MSTVTSTPSPSSSACVNMWYVRPTSHWTSAGRVTSTSIGSVSASRSEPSAITGSAVTRGVGSVVVARAAAGVAAGAAGEAVGAAGLGVGSPATTADVGTAGGAGVTLGAGAGVPRAPGPPFSSGAPSGPVEPVAQPAPSRATRVTAARSAGRRVRDLVGAIEQRVSPLDQACGNVTSVHPRTGNGPG